MLPNSHLLVSRYSSFPVLKSPACLLCHVTRSSLCFCYLPVFSLQFFVLPCVSVTRPVFFILLITAKSSLCLTVIKVINVSCKYFQGSIILRSHYSFSLFCVPLSVSLRFFPCLSHFCLSLTLLFLKLSVSHIRLFLSLICFHLAFLWHSYKADKARHIHRLSLSFLLVLPKDNFRSSNVPFIEVLRETFILDGIIVQILFLLL